LAALVAARVVLSGVNGEFSAPVELTGWFRESGSVKSGAVFLSAVAVLVLLAFFLDRSALLVPV